MAARRAASAGATGRRKARRAKACTLLRSASTDVTPATGSATSTRRRCAGSPASMAWASTSPATAR